MKNIFIISFLVSALFIFGCKKEPSEVSQELEVDAIVEQQAAFGWQANQMVQTGGEIEELTRNSEFLEGDMVDTLGGVNMLKKKAREMTEQFQLELQKNKGLYKPLGDSLVFTINYPLRGVRTALYYDSQTGIARYYEVKYTHFAVWQSMNYDSSEIKVDVNFTLFDPSDDILKSLHRTQLFKDNYFIQSIVSDILITDLNGSDITGVEITQDTYYNENRYLAHLRRFVDLNPDHSGTLREDFEFKDGKTSSRTVTFYSDFTGTFEKKFRDGTLVTGTFDSVEDDLHGAWTELTQFPAGRYLDKIERAAEVQITLPDSIFEGSFSEIVYFSSGNIDTSTIDITIQEVGGLKTMVLDIRKKNGAHGTLTLEEQQDVVLVTGNWTTWDGYYIEISDTQIYFDGSGHIHYEVWSSYQSYQNGDLPIIVVDYYFSPNQDGTGTITYDNETYQITADESGQGTLSKDGKSKAFNLIQ